MHSLNNSNIEYVIKHTTCPIRIKKKKRPIHPDSDSCDITVQLQSTQWTQEMKVEYNV